MKVTFHLEHEGLLNAIQRGDERLISELRGVVRSTAQAVKTEAQAAAPVFTGTLRRRIRMRTGRDGLSATVKSAAPHSHLVAGGRKPGRLPPFGPGTPIAVWAKRHGINPFLLARAIAARGTRANRFFEIVVNRHRLVFLQRIGQVVAQFGRDFSGP